MNKETLYSLFTNAALKHRNKIAIIDENEYTYKQLVDRVESCSQELIKNNISINSNVIVYMTRGIDYITTILAISKIGATFVPIDTIVPLDRVKYIKNNCNAEYIVTNQEKKNLFNIDGVLKTNRSWFENTVEVRNQTKYDVSQTAYIIYTSGSTGNPKGVKIRNEGFVYLDDFFKKYIDLKQAEKIIQFASISFDASIWEITMSLFTGSTLVIWKEQSNDIEIFKKFIFNNRVTVATLPPNYVSMFDEELVNYFKVLITAGSEPSARTFKKIDFDNTRYINAYGPTECTVCASVWEVTKAQEIKGKIPIGSIQQQNLSILTKNGLSKDFNQSGELVVSGECVLQGYVRLEEETNRKTIQIDGERYYKTGDIVKVDENGLIYFQGRQDNQIKLNGYRIELEEVERNIYQCSTLEEFVVVEKHNNLVCFYSGISDIEVVKNKLKQKLPNYMIPQIFHKVEKFEYTTSGKIDKNRIDFPGDKSKSANTSEILKILESILPIEITNFDENFMEYGLNSIGMIKLVEKIKKELGISISINDIIQNDTVNKLTKFIKNIESSEKEILLDSPILIPDKSSENDWFPMTNIQAAYLLGRNNYSEMGGFGTHGYFEIETSLDCQKLKHSLNEVINSQGMLRAIFSDDLKQKILPNNLEYNMNIVDMRGRSCHEVNQKIESIRENLSHQVFDYSKWPLFDISAMQIDEEKSIIFISIDGLVADADSMKIFANQWMLAYNGKNEKDLKPKISFRDYMIAMNSETQKNNRERAKQYWLPKINELPPSPIIFDNAAKGEALEFKRKTLTFSIEMWEKIKELCKSNKITPTTFFTQVYFEVLLKWSENKKISINLSVFNRKNIHEDVKLLIGDFTCNTIISNLNQRNSHNFYEKCILLQNEMLQSIDNIDFDGIDILREYKRTKKENLFLPYVVTSLITENYDRQAYDYLGKLRYGISQTPQVYIDMQIANDNEGILINWDYSVKKFSSSFIENIVDTYKKIIIYLINGGDSCNKILSDFDEKKIIDYNSGNKLINNEKRLEELFFMSARNFSENIAVKNKNTSITYGELAEKVHTRIIEFKDILKKTGNHNIGLIDNRNCETIVDMIAILASGNTFVPVDKDCPKDRLDYIKKISNISYMNTDISENTEITFKDDEIINGNEGGNNLAYIIFTSGSTGKPKGVEIEHSSVINTILGVNEKIDVDSSDRFLLISSLSFDLAIYDIWGALSTGASCYILEDRRDMEDLSRVLSQEKITVWNSVPQIMNSFLNYKTRQKAYPLKRVVSLGEEELNKYIDESIIFNKEKSLLYKEESAKRFIKSSYSDKHVLPKNNKFLNSIINRKSIRSFKNIYISKAEFENIISSMAQVDSEEVKYLYPSAGGLYPLDIYIGINKNRVEGYEAGVYYYNPFANTLYKLEGVCLDETIHYYSNKEISKTSAFSIYFVYNTEFNIKKYGSEGYKYALIDSGYLAQHLTTIGNLNNVASCAIGQIDNDVLKQKLNLNNNQYPIHSILFGKSNINYKVQLLEESILFKNGKNYSEKNWNSFLRKIMLSGDNVSTDLIYRIREELEDKVSLYSFGGATECSIFSVYYSIEKDISKLKVIPYGIPLPNQKLWVVDNQLNIVPVGVMGEIVIGGLGVGRGYSKNKEKTEQNFVNHNQLGRIYKTGDFGILDSTGNIIFKGRKDDQIKINGYRVELSEIESTIKTTCGFEEIVIGVYKTENKSDKLVAFVKSIEDVEVIREKVIKIISNKIPSYMIPQEYIKIDLIPTTDNGKVNRSKLIEFYVHQNKVFKEINSEDFKNNSVDTNLDIDIEIVEKVRQIFSDILSVDNFSNDDTIFDLGGDSIQIVSIQKKIEKELNISFKVIDIFENNTVNKLSKLLVENTDDTITIQGVLFPKDFYSNNLEKNADMESISEQFDISIEGRFTDVFTYIGIIMLSASKGDISLLVNSEKQDKLTVKNILLEKKLLDINETKLKDIIISKIEGSEEIQTSKIKSQSTIVTVTNKKEYSDFYFNDLIVYIDEKKEKITFKYNNNYLRKSKVEILKKNVAKLIEKFI